MFHFYFQVRVEVALDLALLFITVSKIVLHQLKHLVVLLIDYAIL